ncbi:MAG: DUF4383 domain-containing protein [Actinomycetota bacterium]
MEGSSPARLYAVLVGGTLVVIGIIGFFINASFDVGNSVQAENLVGVSINGWENVIHIVTGGLGLLLAGTRAREYALGLGAVYLLVAFLGFIDFGSGDTTDTILKLIPVNTEANLVHLVLGVVGVAAGLATPKQGARTATPPPRATA